MIKHWLQQNLRGDAVLWGIVMAISLISVAVVYSATGTLAYRQMDGNTEYFLFKHTSLIVIGLAFMWFAHKINYRYYSRLSQVALILSVPLLLFTYFYGANINEASRWITIPVINQTFQPSDLAKLALISYLASMLSKKQHVLDDWKRNLVPIFFWTAFICALIAMTNTSTAVLLFITCLLLMFIGRVPMKSLAAFVLVGMLAGGIGLAAGQRLGTAISRVQDFMDPTETAFQLEQSYIAIATGGVVGKGPGNSDQRDILPHPYSDFIYAIILEEYGLVGGVVVLFLYLSLLYRGLVTVSKSNGAFGGLLSAGLSFSLVIQGMINMGVAVGLGPITGLPLPLLSMGGTSLIFTGISLGIILSVSRTESEQERAALGVPASTSTSKAPVNA
jgi:cell division protein FtsW